MLKAPPGVLMCSQGWNQGWMRSLAYCTFIACSPHPATRGSQISSSPSLGENLGALCSAGLDPLITALRSMAASGCGLAAALGDLMDMSLSKP